MALNQRQVKNFRFETLEVLKKAKGRVGELAYCSEMETMYEFLVSEDIANDSTVTTTGNGGNTRWIGKSGKYMGAVSLHGITAFPLYPHEGLIIRLKDHAVLNDGLYVYNGTSWLEWLTW